MPKWHHIRSWNQRHLNIFRRIDITERIFLSNIQIITVSSLICLSSSRPCGLDIMVGSELSSTESNCYQTHTQSPGILLSWPHREGDSTLQLAKEPSENKIEPTQAKDAASNVFEQKKDGSRCFCVDYRKLNNLTRRNVCIIPRMDEYNDSFNKTIVILII